MLLALLALAAACGSEEPEEARIPGRVDAVRDAAAQAMGEVETVRFAIEREGAAVYLDEGATLAFETADGRYAAPASADALITLRSGGIATEVGAVAIDGSTWITNPATGRWEPAPPSLRFDPATLFDPERGWRPLLASGLRDAELVDPEPDADGRYHLRGVARRENVAVLTGGLIEAAVPIDIWVDAVSGRVVEARFDAEVPEGVSRWRILHSDYGADVEIEPPEVGAAP